MLNPEYFLAAALLLAPQESPIPPIDAEEWPAVRGELTKMAVEMQILDKRETDFVLQKPEDIKGDLAMLRQRHHDLKNVPRLEDLARLPGRDEINGMLNFNRNYRTQMEARLVSEPHKADYYREAMNEADQLYQLWDAVREVRCDFYYVTVRRQALRKLKSLAGDEAFHAGQMPPCVPVWRFQEVK